MPTEKGRGAITVHATIYRLYNALTVFLIKAKTKQIELRKNNYMKLLKSSIVALAITFSMGAASTAIAAGKIENATGEQVKEAIQTALTDSTSALDGLKSGSNKEVVLQHIATARQATKQIEVGTTLDPIRSKASGQLRTANTAISNGETANAEAALVEAIKNFEQIKSSYK